DHPVDITYSEGSIGNSVTWNATGDNPSYYSILRDGITIKFGDWNSSDESISINVDNLSLGDYNYTLIVSNLQGFSSHDSVIVHVIDSTDPQISHPDDMEYVLGTDGNDIEWTVSDLHHATWEVYRNGTLVDSGEWTHQTMIFSYAVNGLNLGIYNFTILVTDT
ncbi:MAG: hypothetical protein P1Q69_18435, partial [Candidatus Thorarchaeota archaeon]|nr:hypothetical protein [Candidatus Thorarchaeota archaeon]